VRNGDHVIEINHTPLL